MLRKSIVKGITISIFIWVLPILSLAQTDPTGILGVKKDDLTAGGTAEIIFSLAQWFLIIVGTIAVIVALYSAFLFITGGSNEEQIKKAKKTLIWALVGVVIATVAFSIITFAESLITQSGSRSTTGDQCGGCPGGTECVYYEDRQGFSGYRCE